MSRRRRRHKSSDHDKGVENDDEHRCHGTGRVGTAFHQLIRCRPEHRYHDADQRQEYSGRATPEKLDHPDQQEIRNGIEQHRHGCQNNVEASHPPRSCATEGVDKSDHVEQGQSNDREGQSGPFHAGTSRRRWKRRTRRDVGEGREGNGVAVGMGAQGRRRLHPRPSGRPTGRLLRGRVTHPTIVSYRSIESPRLVVAPDMVASDSGGTG